MESECDRKIFDVSKKNTLEFPIVALFLSLVDTINVDFERLLYLFLNGLAIWFVHWTVYDTLKADDRWSPLKTVRT